MNVITSFSFFKSDRYEPENIIPKNIQLSLYKMELFSTNKDQILKSLDENNTNVRVLHLPIDCLRFESRNVFDLITLFKEKYQCRRFVIHPNRGINEFVYKYVAENKFRDAILCIENFPYKKRKVIRTPIEIIELCSKFLNIRMTFDTSHADKIWFSHMILPTILKYTEVIHLSNRNEIEKKQHLPINSPEGDLNINKFLNDLKMNRWDGDVVLEYMPEYSNKLEKNAIFVKRLLGLQRGNN